MKTTYTVKAHVFSTGADSAARLAFVLDRLTGQLSITKPVKAGTFYKSPNGDSARIVEVSGGEEAEPKPEKKKKGRKR